MLLSHAGITNRDADQARSFYRDFLGLELVKESTVPGDLVRQLFAVDRDIDMLVFEGDGVKIEVFICSDCSLPSPDFNHIALLLDNFQGILDSAPAHGIDVISGSRGEKTVHFLRDFTGNLIEIKQK